MSALATVYRVLDPADAQLICSRLEAAGLIVFIHNELSALTMDGYAQAAGGVLVKVPAEDEQAALELIAAKSDE